MSKFKVMLTDTCFPDISIEKDLLKTIDAELVMPGDTDAESLIETGKDCDAVIVDFAQLTEHVINNLKECKIITRVGIGLNVIDIEAASRNRIMVANIPDYCLDEVADHAMTLALACSRRVLQYHNNLLKGDNTVYGIGEIFRLANRKFCLFGLGNIALKVAHRAKAFGFKVYAYDPYVGDDVFRKNNIIKMEKLDELFENADILSIHAPLTRDTEGIVNKDLFKRMKRDAIIINTSRGAIINEEDLIDALKKKNISCAGLDVTKEEPISPDSELLKIENVILTPHVGFYSRESEEELRIKVCEETINGLINGKPKNFVNEKYLK